MDSRDSGSNHESPVNSQHRYARQMAVPGIGEAGQKRISEAHALILGLGGLGSVTATYLARAGIGILTLVDCGCVDKPDLNRQIFYVEKDLGLPKADVAGQRIREINSKVILNVVPERVEEANLEEMVGHVDIVLDGLDSLSLRMMANRVCCEQRKIFIHGGINGTKGVVSSIVPKEGPCLRCIYGERAFDTPGVPVLGPVPGIVASIQSLEALKYLGGLGLALKGRLLMFEGRTMTFSYRNVERKNGCQHCANEKNGVKAGF